MLNTKQFQRQNGLNVCNLIVHMKTEESAIFELYQSGELSEAHIQKIWFPIDSSGVIRPKWTIDYDVQEQLLLAACYKSHTNLIAALLSPMLLYYCCLDTIEEIIEVARERSLLSVVRFYVEYSIGDLNEILYWTCKQPSIVDDVELKYIFNLLMRNDAVRKSFESNVCIGAAAKYGSLYALNELLKFDDVDPSDDQNHALCMASKYGHTEVVKRLLQDHRVVPSDDENRAIRLACRYNHIEVVRVLLDSRRVDPSCKSNVCMKHAVEHAVETGCCDLVMALLTDGRVSMSNAHVIDLLERSNFQ